MASGVLRVGYLRFAAVSAVIPAVCLPAVFCGGFGRFAMLIQQGVAGPGWSAEP